MGRSTTKNGKKGNGYTGGRVSLEESMQRGVAAAEKGNRTEAYRIFKETTNLHPNVADAWVWLGGTSERLDEAERAFEKAYAIDPDNEKASLGLRWVRLRQKESMSAVAGAPAPVPQAPSVPAEESQPAASQEPTVQAVAAPPVPEESATFQANAAPSTPEAAAVPSMPEFPGRRAGAVEQTPEEAGGFAGMSTTAMIIIAVVVVLVLAVLGYWIFIMPH